MSLLYNFGQHPEDGSQAMPDDFDFIATDESNPESPAPSAISVATITLPVTSITCVGCVNLISSRLQRDLSGDFRGVESYQLNDDPSKRSMSFKVKSGTDPETIATIIRAAGHKCQIGVVDDAETKDTRATKRKRVQQ